MATRVEASKLYKPIEAHQWPFVYSSAYDISFGGLEKLHPFDAAKWGKIFRNLQLARVLDERVVVEPEEATEQDLLVVHSERYLDSLKRNRTVASITEIPLVALMPSGSIHNRVLKPFRYQTGGTILAAKLALERGWAMNIGGGFHHCCGEMGGGFCVYADITLALGFLFEANQIKKAMIIDLDAHQGNGYARDFMKDDRVYILDVYNAEIYPHDTYAKNAIKKKVEVRTGIETDEYLTLIQSAICEALDEFVPDIVVYNAGTDILKGDPLGRMQVTAEGIIQRDNLVFQAVRRREQGPIPVVMVTSGGYQKCTADIVAKSVVHLRNNQLMDGPSFTPDVTKKKKWFSK